LKLTIGSQQIATDTTFLIEMGIESWHACAYPGRPGVLRVRPGDSCDAGACAGVSLELLKPAQPPFIPEKIEAAPVPEAPTEDADPLADFMPGFAADPLQEEPPVEPKTTYRKRR